LKEAEVGSHHPYLEAGGSWKPTECVARYKVSGHDNTVSGPTDAFDLTYQFSCADAEEARLGVDCVIFHDVDMFPQDDHNSYGCPASPRHIGAFVSNLGYQ
uniref:Galactosyltransferase N-terminal domain-containing protein n=1 Tax=Parascaris equorum TaxID=6256 RepID=A0A914RL63_PAREQ